MSSSGDRGKVVSAAVVAGRVADRLEAEQRDASVVRKAIERDTAELGFAYSDTVTDL